MKSYHHIHLCSEHVGFTCFFLGMTHATKKIMDINATIRVCQKLSVHESEGSASSCSCFHHVKSEQRWSKKDHTPSLRVQSAHKEY